MNAAIRPSPAFRLVVARHPAEPIVPLAPAGRLPTLTGRRAADRLLVAGAVALLGLGTAVASLSPFPGDRGDFSQGQPAMVIARGDAPEPAAPGGDPAEPPTASGNLAGGSAFEALPSGSGTGPWRSPLYPQIGVTLWDRIRISPPRDRRTFLIGTAIQVHARAIAATPARRSALPHGVD